MSAKDQKQIYSVQTACLLYPRKQTRAVRYTLWANSGLMHRSKKDRYSITSSAVVRSDGDKVRPSALAVFKLMASSNLVGCSTGRSAGLPPCRILCTYPAARRNSSGWLGPSDLRPPANTFSFTT